MVWMWMVWMVWWMMNDDDDDAVRALWKGSRTIDHRAVDYNRTQSKCAKTSLLYDAPVSKRPVIKRYLK